MLPRKVLPYGKDEPLPTVIPLRAGPVDLVFAEGGLRYLRCGGREAVRRIYMAVRDANWGTVPARISKLSIDAGRDHFHIAFTADHREGPVDFRWEARIDGTPDGCITFSMDGKALSTFRRNRIGFCVLHPVEGFAGQRCEIETTDGTKRVDTVPADVSPHQPFLGVSAITHEIAPGCRAEVRFDGEVFEMEDHRNWTDAGFKTYGTPLSLPFPVEVPAGTVIRQRVLFQLHGRAPRPTASQGRPVAGITISNESKPMPELGVAAKSEEWTPGQIDRLRELRLSHLSVEAVTLDTPHPAVQELGVPLEVVLVLGAKPRQQLEQAAARSRDLALNVRRWIVLSAQDAVTPPALAALARELLAGAPLVGGTRGNFAELNRNRPEPGVFDGVCFPINPQVHANDNTTMAENCAAQRDVIDSARRFCGRAPIYATPVTLRPQFNPVATGAAARPEPDPRQASLFCAAWTVASFKYLAEGGAAGVTYYEAAGPGGVMPDARSTPGSVFPVWHVLADLGDFQGGAVIPSVSSHPLLVECLAIRSGGRTRVLLANLSPHKQSVKMQGAARLRLMTAENAEAAMLRPAQFRGTGRQVELPRGLWLEPYAVATVDFGPLLPTKEKQRP